MFIKYVHITVVDTGTARNLRFERQAATTTAKGGQSTGDKSNGLAAGTDIWCESYLCSGNTISFYLKADFGRVYRDRHGFSHGRCKPSTDEFHRNAGVLLPWFAVHCWSRSLTILGGFGDDVGAQTDETVRDVSVKPDWLDGKQALRSGGAGNGLGYGETPQPPPPKSLQGTLVPRFSARENNMADDGKLRVLTLNAWYVTGLFAFGHFAHVSRHFAR